MFKNIGLKTRDFLKGLIMAIGTPVLYMVQEMVPGWNIDPIYKAAISAAATYLLKNFLTDDVAAAKKVIREEAKK